MTVVSERRDWTVFLVRFACGAVLGVCIGFGVWIQMCRPLHMASGRSFSPYLTEVLGLTECTNSGLAGLVIVGLFALITGLIVGLWRLVDAA